MAIYNFGSVFGSREILTKPNQETSELLAQFNHSNLDIQQARLRANEIINISGAKVMVYLRTDNADYDSTWDEDPNPTYWKPWPLKAVYSPKPLETEMKKWGPDTKINDQFVFSYEHIFDIAKERMLRVGDVIRIDYNLNLSKLNVRDFRILNGTPFGNYKYNWLYYACEVENLTGDITVQPDNEMEPVEDGLRTGYSEGSV